MKSLRFSQRGKHLPKHGGGTDQFSLRDQQEATTKGKLRMNTSRRVSYVFLCAVPVLAIGFAAVRPLRVSGVYQSIGWVLFSAIVLAMWVLGARTVRSGAQEKRMLALAGGLLLVPFALIALLWVGLGPPWDATPPENVMRYFVLLVSSIAVSGGFIILKEALSDAGERCYSTLAFAAAVLAAAAYVVWTSFVLAAVVMRVRDGQAPAAIGALADVLDLLLNVACFLTYLATAGFAMSFGRAHWLGRYATRTYVIVSLAASLCLIARGWSLPDPATVSPAWYTQPGFVAGIPAIPFIMPFLLGVVLLRRAGDEQR